MILTTSAISIGLRSGGDVAWFAFSAIGTRPAMSNAWQKAAK